MAKLKEVSDSVTPMEAPHISKSAKEASEDTIKKLIQEETRLVRGRFRNHETPGGTAKIIIKKYKDVPLFEKEMMDGQEYEVPLYVARHLQGFDASAKAIGGRINSCAYPVHGYKTTKDGFPDKNLEAGMTVPIMHKRRYSFESMEFENLM